MSDKNIKIKNINIQERCEVCHQSDMFEPETQFCARCQHIALVKAIEEPKINAAPLPEFLARRVSSNTAIRCTTCNEFIMSRSPTCRHCGTYVRFEEAAQSAQDEQQLARAFEKLHQCKDASSLSWEFIRLHFWGFPLTLLLTPLSAIVSLVLFFRTLWYSYICHTSFSPFVSANDTRITENKREAWLMAGKSASYFLLTATLGTVIVVSGLIFLPAYWDNYAKGRRQFDARNFTEAEQLFATALKNNPKNVDARIYYARAIWSQYVNDSNADQQKNKDIVDRSIAEFRATLDETNDLKTKDLIYGEISDIYKTINNRSEFEQWTLAQAKLPGQSRENQVDCYMKLGSIFAKDITDIYPLYEIKNSLPRAWQPISSWKPEDSKKTRQAAAKASYYFDQALAVGVQTDIVNNLRNHLDREFERIGLTLDRQDTQFINTSNPDQP